MMHDKLHRVVDVQRSILFQAGVVADDRSKIRKSLQGFHAARNCTETSASEGGYLIGYRLVA